MRRPIIAANWKMNKTRTEAEQFADTLLGLLGGGDAPTAEAVLSPPFPWLCPLGERLRGSEVSLAAQNVHAENEGAYTGEVSARMLVDAGCRYVIVGHSERRTLFHETDEGVAAKRSAVERASLTPILCVGETLEQREAGETETVLKTQLEGSLAGIDASTAARLVVAYEPVWAIGTGRTASPTQAQEAHACIRERLAQLLGGGTAEQIRIQYGGSVKPENAASLLAEPDIDGALVGGASLDPHSFFAILTAGSAPREA